MESGQGVLDHLYFTISAKMVKDGMVGTFPDSIIIVGGCQSARSHDLMESLVRRGASQVLGWAEIIESKDNDRAMIWLLEEILVKEVPLYDAVAELNKEMVLDFESLNKLKLFTPG